MIGEDQPEDDVFGQVYRPPITLESEMGRIIEGIDLGKYLRVGAITILNVGYPLIDSPGFHTADVIYPYRFKSTRIYWSSTRPFTRTLYVFEVLAESDLPENISPPVPLESYREQLGLESDEEAERYLPPVFRLVALDAPNEPILARTPVEIMTILRARVKEINSKIFEAGKTLHRLQDNSFGLTPNNFFGIGISWIRCAVERMPDSAAAMSLAPPGVPYKPCFRLPTSKDVVRVEQERVEQRAKLSRPNVNGSARATGVVSVHGDGGGERKPMAAQSRIVTRILTKATEDTEKKKENLEDPEDVLRTRRIIEYNKERYYKLSTAYIINPFEKLGVRRSHIHGWGLFSRIAFTKDEMIVEYIGEKIRQAVADQREKRYDEEDVGSCYLFRLDKINIIDATRTGGMARFMNHSCEPNAYARVIPTDHTGMEKHIIIMAQRDIAEGEEITYDYKFPIEDDKLRCYCGASRCRGTMN